MDNLVQREPGEAIFRRMMSSVGISYREKDANGWTVMAQWAARKTTCSESEKHLASWLLSAGAPLALSDSLLQESVAEAWRTELLQLGLNRSIRVHNISMTLIQTGPNRFGVDCYLQISQPHSQ